MSITSLELVDEQGKRALFDISWPPSGEPLYARRARTRGFGETPTARVQLTLHQGSTVEFAGNVWQFIDSNLPLSALNNILSSADGQALLADFLVDFGMDALGEDGVY